MSGPAGPLLRVEGLRAGYGRMEVFFGVSLRLEAHTLCAIVGANGAGEDDAAQRALAPPAGARRSRPYPS